MSFPTIDRRQFLTQSGLGVAALATLLEARGDDAKPKTAKAKAKRVIYLFQSGAPSQMDLFDHKPKLADLRASELPDSIRMGQRLTGMTSRQEKFPLAPSIFRFARRGKSSAWI